MNSKARITYRFDKQNGAHEQREPENKENANHSNVVQIHREELKFTTERGTWNSPFQNDPHALEQLIREADREPVIKSAPALTPRTVKKGMEPAQVKSASEQEAAPEESKVHAWENAYETPLPIYNPYDSVDNWPAEDEAWQGIVKRKQTNQPMIDSEVPVELEGESGLPVTEGKRGYFQTATVYRHGRNPSWYKVFASVAGAVVTGALFGYFVLALFTGEVPSGPDTGTKAVLPASGATNGSKGTDVNADVPAAGKSATGTTDQPSGSSNGAKTGSAPAKTEGTAAAGAAKIKADIPAVSYFMLQYGVFSNQEGMDEAVKGLTAQGLAATTYESGEDYRVYVGMASERGEATELGKSMTGMEVYVKQIDRPGLSAIPYTGDSAEIVSFFKQTDELIRLMNAATLEKLNKSSKSTSADWENLHQKWIKTAAAAEQGMTDKQQKTALLKVIQQVNKAAVAYGEYAKKPSDAHLWSIQNTLMEAVFIQKSWFASIDAL
ncbi:SPOR domain-containing protein [Paenibacillus nasutitermitis]|uniref:SPOR domain-containing protein n=1 Tax=Paenibacillus nasutitermitis TaxID=1652958 RepID=A0A916YP95_9BACL|nr:SPOR domain-containing protein [Paenibacillus nasutitermitis]GGD54568.1 hypothetical protein GCM10010911_10230 [Paenibacillus nasutitermitis]